MQFAWRAVAPLLLVLGLCRAQDDLDEELKKIFGTPLEDIAVTSTTGRTTIEQEDGPCVCVPYWLCDPTTNVITSDGKFDGYGVIDIRFKPEGCQESVDICCKNPRAKEDPVPLAPHPERIAGCGIRNSLGVDFQITGAHGNESEFGEFPWTVAVLWTGNGSAQCGGSLIHPQVVLTGAHCVHSLRPGQLKVRAGEWDTQTTKERLPHQERPVASILEHPAFNTRTVVNDIALLFLAEPFTLIDNVNTICLPEQDKNFEDAKNCFVTGWGKSKFAKADRYAVIMKKVPLDAVPFATCQTQFQHTRLGPRFKLSRTFLCAGGKEGVDACQGDGGGPLACPAGDRYEQAGIVAWGIGCGQREVPGAYTRVAQYRSWVDAAMRERALDPSSYERRATR